MHRHSPINAAARMRSFGAESARGFTLIEVIVVVLLLGVVAGMTVPRLVTGDRRRAEASVAAVAGLLTIIAQRELLGGERLSLEYSAEDGRFRLMALRVRGDWRGDGHAEWGEDPLAPAAVLEGVSLHGALFDGVEADPKRWRWELAPGQPRRALSLVFRTEPRIRPQAAWLIELLPSDSQARISVLNAAEGFGGDPAMGRVIDLDALGLGDSTW